MTTHDITLDQISDPLDTRDVGYAAFCECGWRGQWHHSDAQASWPNDQAYADAEQDASDEGDEHLADEGAEQPPNIPAFLALTIPATDANGYAR